MDYKKMKQNLGISNLTLVSAMKLNHNFKNMEILDNANDWSGIDAISLSHYTVGTSSEGANAYPPLLLYK